MWGALVIVLVTQRASDAVRRRSAGLYTWPCPSSARGDTRAVSSGVPGRPWGFQITPRGWPGWATSVTGWLEGRYWCKRAGRATWVDRPEHSAPVSGLNGQSGDGCCTIAPHVLAHIISLGSVQEKRQGDFKSLAFPMQVYHKFIASHSVLYVKHGRHLKQRNNIHTGRHSVIYRINVYKCGRCIRELCNTFAVSDTKCHPLAGRATVPRHPGLNIARSLRV